MNTVSNGSTSLSAPSGHADTIAIASAREVGGTRARSGWARSLGRSAV
jgi:hypothetical protein